MELQNDVCKESKLFLQKLFMFKEEHSKIKKLCYELLENNELANKRIKILESELELEKKNGGTNAILSQQRSIIEYFKNQGDYVELKTTCDSLKKKIELLENQVQMEKSFYEQKMQKLTEEKIREVNETRSICENDAKEKFEQMQRNYDDLNRKNAQLNTTLESVGIETSEIIARLEMERKEEIFFLKSENELLSEKLRKQEDFYVRKINNLEKNIEEKTKFIMKLTHNNRNKKSLFQPLDEAFRTEKVVTKSMNIGFTASDDTERRFSPIITDDDILREL